MTANGTDLLVVGGGLEGSVSALAAAREAPDSAVCLVELDPERFRRETGSIGVLGYTPDGEGPVREPFAALPDLPADHPYSRVGLDAVRRSLSFFADVTSYDGGDSEANALVPTCNGTLKPTYLYPPSVTQGLASDRRETLLVGFDRVTDFDAELAAARLDDRLPYDVRGTTLTFPGATGEADSPVRRFADELDENEPLAEGPVLRRALAGTIRSPLDIEPRIGFPAVLGREAHEAVREDLAAILQADLFEVPLGPPSIPGMRLGSRLRSALDSAGVDVVTGASVSGFGVRDNRIEQVHVSEANDDDANGAGETIDRTYEASSYVLATGGLASSGLESDPRRITEPVFDCHVPHPGDRSDWVADEFLGDQPFARFGLDVDERLRPVAADGRAEYANLHAAGTVLGGGDFAAEQSSGGVAIATGYRAGRVAID
jgi:glycerol-3-phosphate dehydrogenase subunit B